MEGMQRAMKWWCILLVVQVGESQFCPGTADTFVSLPRIVGARKEDLVSFPSNEVSLGEWIFPSFSFQCSGRISGWIFRAEPGVDLASIDRVPQWSIYRDQPVTPLNMLDFEVIRSIGEVEETRDPGVYRYTLNSTMDVQMGDFVGVSYENSEDSQPTNLRLSFLNVSIDGRETPISFRRQDFSASVFFIVNPKTTENVTGYMPLVTPIIAEPATIPPTSTATEPQPATALTATAPPTAPPTSTATAPPTAPPTSIAPTAPPTSTATEPPTATTPPTSTATEPTAPPITGIPTSSATEPSFVAETTNPKSVSESTSTSVNPMESDPQAASGASLGVIVGIIAGLFIVVLVMAVLLVCLLVLMKRRKHNFGSQSTSSNNPMDPDQLYATVEEKHQQQDMELKQNQAYAVASTNIPVEPNQCYIPTTPSVDPDQLYATVRVECQQQGFEITENLVYTTASNIQLESNQCYAPSVDLDQKKRESTK